MSGFIVWDAKKRIFIDEDILKHHYFISSDGKLKFLLYEDMLDCDEWEFAFKNIDLKDINGKSIYADSSIVEFKNIGSNYTGYFTFDLVKLCYKIIVLDIKSVRKEFIFNSNNIENIKIIDTIQQNKLGLIK